jgi:hypothetical protein
VQSHDTETQKFLEAFGEVYSDWLKSGRRVDLTADFGERGGDAEQIHNNCGPCTSKTPRN